MADQNQESITVNGVVFTHCYHRSGDLNMIDLAYADGRSLWGQRTAEEMEKLTGPDSTDPHYKGAHLMLISEGEKLIKDAENEKYVNQTPEAINEKEHDRLLNILPPMRWINRGGTESFAISEAVTETVYLFVVRIGDQYWKLNDRLSTSHDGLVRRCKAI